MSWKLFLLEETLGYQFTAESNGLAMVERMNMLSRYWKEKKEYNDNISGGKSARTKGKGKGLIK